jgi:hypothetical protein
LFGELYGAESLTQVYGHLCDFLAEADMTSLQYLLYDDACHLLPFVQKPIRKTFSSATEQMGRLNILLDKLHFIGHTGGKIVI